MKETVLVSCILLMISSRASFVSTKEFMAELRFILTELSGVVEDWFCIALLPFVKRFVGCRVVGVVACPRFFL